MRHCEACGARNPASAQWCNQCFAALTGHNEAAQGQQARTPAAEDGIAGGSGPGAFAPPGARPVVRRADDGSLGWDCPTCGRAASLSDDACPACATSFMAGLAGSGPGPSAAGGDADPRVLVALTVVLPGAGHVAAGRVGSGLARILLYALWLSGGVALALAAAGHSLAAGAPLLMGALALWLASLVDVLGLRSGVRQLAEGRALLWLVVGVTCLALLGAMVAAAAVATPGGTAGLAAPLTG